MIKYPRPLLSLKSDRGAAIILVAVSILAFIGLAALAVDVGYLMVTRNELQNISDAASLAATRKLGSIYENMTYQEQQNYNAGTTGDDAVLIEVAKEVGLKNRAGEKNIAIDDGDVTIGTWDAQAKILTPTLSQPDAVRVKARRDGTANGPIATVFAAVIGTNSIDVTAKATAALTGESTAGEGGLPLPIGISQRWFLNPDFCGKHIRLYPSCPHEPCDATTEGCGGWTTYTDNFFNNQPPNASKLRDILINLQTGLQSPYTEAGKTMYEFVGGTIASDFPYMKQLFDTMKVKNDGIYDSDTDPNTWTAKVVVYESDTCANPNQSLKVIGFTTVVITQVLESPEKIIEGMVLCDNVEPGRGGGGEYGTKGSIPNLVQ